ncbi:MAG: DNA topoisomerase IV subunit A [Nitrososphaeria archaeon]
MKNSPSTRKKEVKGLLERLGEKIYQQIEQGNFPEVEMPSRSVKNIVYDKELKQYVVGGNMVKRNAKNIKHLRPFTQTIWLAFFVNKLINEGKTSTLRDVYYSAQAFNIEFTDQAESDEIITDLEALLRKSREDYNVYPEERSAIYGDLTITYTVPGHEGKKLNLASHPDGYLIGSSLSTAEFTKTSAKLVFAVEKGGLFTRFVENNVHEKYRALIVDTAGQPPRSTRYFLKRLNQELGLPVYVLTDADPYGMHIFMVIASGSANAAHLTELTVPTAKWLGVTATDIETYKLPYVKLKDEDVKRAYELKNDPRYKDVRFQKELDVFIKKQKKAELEAFAKYSLDYIVEKYLPDKLKEINSK